MSNTHKRFIKAVSAAIGLALVAVFLVGEPSSAKTGPQDVNVVNPATNPVPTAAQGTTNVAGTVGITGTPNVQISGTPTVQVASAATPFTQLTGVSHDSEFGESCDPIEVPAGHRLTIEQVSFEAHVPADDPAPDAYLLVVHDGNLLRFSPSFYDSDAGESHSTHRWSGQLEGPYYVDGEDVSAQACVSGVVAESRSLVIGTIEPIS